MKLTQVAYEAGTSEILQAECPCCGGDLQAMGRMGRFQWFRCRHCGMEVSRELRKEKEVACG